MNKFNVSSSLAVYEPTVQEKTYEDSEQLLALSQETKSIQD